MQAKRQVDAKCEDEATRPHGVKVMIESTSGRSVCVCVCVVRTQIK